MSTGHYRSNLRDTYFNLFEVLDIGRTSLGAGPFTDVDEDMARSALSGLNEMIASEWSVGFAAADREGARFDGKGNVTLPSAVTRALSAYYQGGWNTLGLPAHLGGAGAPPSVTWAGFELLSGGHAAATFYLLADFVSSFIDRLGTADQKARYVSNMVQQHWGATMVLTEPDAGSDVGAGVTRAKHVGGDEFHLEGVKRFITNGDYDFPSNIVHLVLARPDGAKPGTKGLSLFIVPKYWVEADGSIGARNGITVTGLEHKMGLRASATCELTLGHDAPCRGLLLGGKHDGIAQMFHVIEYARMAIGTKSMATLSSAYLAALEYTKLRKQGPDLARALDKSSPRVEIIRHPDVRRMLMMQKVFAEGLRATLLWTAAMQDQVAITKERGGDTAKLDAAVDLMLPLIKGYGSEKVYELLALSLQCFGGSGYCQDVPIEQYVRDQKIDSLYEGTTHIQALDLFFRKVARDRGATLRHLLEEIGTTCARCKAHPQLGTEAAAVATALGHVSAMFTQMVTKVGQSPYHAGLQGNRLLFALSELVIGWRLLIAAETAAGRLGQATEDDAHFYRGKLSAVRFYCQEILPGLATARAQVETSSLELMEMADAEF